MWTVMAEADKFQHGNLRESSGHGLRLWLQATATGDHNLNLQVLIQRDYHNLDKADQSDYKKITIQSEKVSRQS